VATGGDCCSCCIDCCSVDCGALGSAVDCICACFSLLSACSC
jgi:hypothetical protein